MKLPSTHFSLQYGSHLRPVRDWLSLLVVSGMLLVVSVLWSGWLFSRVVNGAVLGTGSVTTPSALNTASLEAIETVFSTRAAESERFKEGRYQFVDPSK